VEELGYAHILADDHALGAHPAGHPGWHGPYDVDTRFHEAFVLYGYLAAITSLELVTGVIILPQRQTALVAKQAAEVDLPTEGRFRLGVGLGWNAVEYEALARTSPIGGAAWRSRSRLLRRLWTECTVTFRGRYEAVSPAGLAPLPVKRPIPIWFAAFPARAAPGRPAGRRLVPAAPARPTP
jgi:alkanesulfonate monooxygenase SsuD/methylene tetrahydromethanopterin reductase-like flavin-dependent oxidoreductase (luciferase family)